jgi:hypothetical protein
MKDAISRGTLLFLVNFNSQRIFGPFAAAGDPGLEDEFEVAFRGKYPAQVRFRQHPDFPADLSGNFRNLNSIDFGALRLPDVLKILKQLCLPADDARRSRPDDAGGARAGAGGEAEEKLYADKFDVADGEPWKECLSDAALKRRILAVVRDGVSEFMPPRIIKAGFDLIDAVDA